MTFPEEDNEKPSRDGLALLVRYEEAEEASARLRRAN
jgi:hypothetical protein